MALHECNMLAASQRVDTWGGGGEAPVLPRPLSL